MLPVYGTNDASDEHSRDNRQTPVTKADATEATEASAVDANSPDDPVELLFSQDDVSAVQDSAVVNVLDPPASISGRSDTADADEPRATPRTSLPLRRSKSQLLRDTVFGASGDELSDIEEPIELHKSTMKTPKDSKKPTTAPRFVATSRRVLDSDDDLPSTPTHPPTQKPKKKLVVVSDDDDEIEEIVPVSKIPTSVISRRRSTLVMTPVVSSRSADLKLSANSNAVAPGNSSRTKGTKKKLDSKPQIPITTDQELLTSETKSEAIPPPPASRTLRSSSKSEEGNPSGVPTNSVKRSSEAGSRALSGVGAELR